MITFWNTDITILTLASLVIIMQSGLWLLKFNKYCANFKINKLLRNQPYKIALIVILSYFVVNGIGVLISNTSIIISKNSMLKIEYGIESVRLILIIILIYKEEQAIYLWLGQFTKDYKVLVSILFSMRNSLNVLIYSLLLMFLLPEFVSLPSLEHRTKIITHMLIIWSLAWIIIQLIAAIEAIYLKKVLNLKLIDYHERGVFTQTKIFKKILIFIIIIIAIAATCLIFEDAKIIGTSILASAGIATGIVGFAANKILSNFFVGIQIAITKPIKINDLVKISDEFGVVEDITLNYATIRLWDQRCLIIPITYLLEKQFYNYSLNSTVITSVIIFFADYNLPVDEVRAYFIQVVNESKYWDHNTVSLQVIGFENKTLKLRGTASTNHPTNAWNLKCEMLEKLAALFSSKYQIYLPKFRLESQI